MNFTAAHVATLTFDGLAVAYGIAAGRAIAAPTARSASIWMNRRDVVRAEVSARGAVVRPGYAGGYMVARWQDFEPAGR